MAGTGRPRKHQRSNCCERADGRLPMTACGIACGAAGQYRLHHDVMLAGAARPAFHQTQRRRFEPRKLAAALPLLDIVVQPLTSCIPRKCQGEPAVRASDLVRTRLLIAHRLTALLDRAFPGPAAVRLLRGRRLRGSAGSCIPPRAAPPAGARRAPRPSSRSRSSQLCFVHKTRPPRSGGPNFHRAARARGHAQKFPWRWPADGGPSLPTSTYLVTN